MNPLILVIAAVGVAAAASRKKKRPSSSSSSSSSRETPAAPPATPAPPAPSGPQSGSLPLPINPFTGTVSPHAFDALRGAAPQSGWPKPSSPKPSTAQGTQGSPDRAHEQGGGGVSAGLVDDAPEPDFRDQK